MKKMQFIYFMLFFFTICKSQTPSTISGWTVWGGGASTISIQTRSGADQWLKVTSSHCTHGAHQYFNTVAGNTYTLNFDLNLGSTSQVNLLIWDVTPSNVLTNLRVISYTANANGITRTFLAGDTRALIQFRQDDCSGTFFFYLDNIDVWMTSTNIVAANPLGKDYRFTFNGKERTDEVYGEGNFYDYGFRVYDSRIGKFLSVDPITAQYPELTPYQFASNTPIMAIDLDGKEALVTIITTNDDGSTSILVMSDQTIEDNAGVSLRNRIVMDGVDMGTTYGELGVEALKTKMLNVRMIDGGYLAYDTPEGATVTTVQGSRTVTGVEGVPVTQLNDFLVRVETDAPIGPISFNIPFDGSTKNGVTPGPVNLAVPSNADPGSAQLNVTLTDFTQPNTSTISVASGTAATNINLVGAANGTAVNTAIPVGSGDNIKIVTPTDASGADDYNLKGSLNYTVTPR